MALLCRTSRLLNKTPDQTHQTCLQLLLSLQSPKAAHGQPLRQCQQLLQLMSQVCLGQALQPHSASAPPHRPRLTWRQAQPLRQVLLTTTQLAQPLCQQMLRLMGPPNTTPLLLRQHRRRLAPRPALLLLLLLPMLWSMPTLMRMPLLHRAKLRSSLGL